MEEHMATKTSPSSLTSRSALQLEAEIRQALCAENGVDIGGLVVRRLSNGICLEGVIRVSSDDFDVCSAVREIEGVGEIVNHLVVCWNCPQHGLSGHEDVFA
jgi:hypothetical protein